MTSFAKGDRNTRYFHSIVNVRRKRFAGQKNLESGRFYQQQFSQEGDPLDFNLLQHVPSMVDQDTNNQLVRMPTLEDMKKAVFELSADSVGGLDSMIAFFDEQTLPKSITHTSLILLPKKNSIETFADVRPISLSKFINKVISRMVQDKLECLLPSIISPNQFGFFKGRCIIENVLLTQKVVTDIRQRGKPANVVLKLDMEKTYNRVSWMFLIRVLRKMGFAKVFIDIVWRLIANNWYSILLNGQASGFFHSTRGVKQRDPLSPALFILSAEVLSRPLNSLFENNDFRSYGMPKWSTNLNHLANADDRIIFTSTDFKTLELIMGVLHGYEQISCQLINKALCAKLWWKFRTTNTLWANYVWIKYYKRHSPENVQWKGGSQLWKVILEARDNIEHEIWWEPRSGTTNVWFDNWTKLGALYHIVPDDFVIDNGVQDVKEHMLQEVKDIGRLKKLFPMDFIVHILEELHFHEPTEEWDRARWMMTPSDKFTIGIAGELIRRKATKVQNYSKSYSNGYHVVDMEVEEYSFTWWGDVHHQTDVSIVAQPTKMHSSNPAIARRISDGSNIVAEPMALQEGLKYCVAHSLLPVVMETDSMTMKMILAGQWEAPWCISLIINDISRLMRDKEVKVYHVLREGTGLADFLTNGVFDFAGVHQFDSIRKQGEFGTQRRNKYHTCELGKLRIITSLTINNNIVVQ
ncbi:uncharacterized protein LOC132624175 [Lycium barbarum]|uniref:uncharacterized protein LOC132624175 n=1 Tax=Lycium barbarum TaxID=112863 RepID=UPI00293E1427|nr:uncharacterized protein LOC132624175 [Lycium barbarum]